MIGVLAHCRRDSRDLGFGISSSKMCRDASNEGPALSRCLVGMNGSSNCSVPEDKGGKCVRTRTQCFGNAGVYDLLFLFKDEFGSWPGFGLCLPGGGSLAYKLIGPWVSCLPWPGRPPYVSLSADWQLSLFKGPCAQPW